MTTACFKIYGDEGHRQKESFNPSHKIKNVDTDALVLNFDKTGTHEYSTLIVNANSLNECYQSMLAIISDGTYENCIVGKIELEWYANNITII